MFKPKAIIPTDEQINDLVSRALEEDLGTGDITTKSILPESQTNHAVVVAKEFLILCGGKLFSRVFQSLDSNVDVILHYEDGDAVAKGNVMFTIKGNSSALLKGERTALNCLQRLSGIATLTHKYVNRAGSSKILDTRKTTPGLRVFEKYAVGCGGGYNHRIGLYDAVLIKDNHIKAAGGITEAVRLVREGHGAAVFVEVETTNLNEVEETANLLIDRILLDNMDSDMISRSLEIIKGRVKTEVSGSINLQKIKELAGLGVDFISVGALTHSAPAVDISMNIK